MIIERIIAFGHRNITCRHNTTIELTKDKELTLKGDGILGIKSSKSCRDLSKKTKKLINEGKKFHITILSENFRDTFYGYGHKDLELLDNKDIIFRKSNYICDRTVLIKCTKSAMELNRDLINSLKNEGRKFYTIFELINDDK
ncbi:MAG: DUF371 domain-containing protein [Promethearchaeota archaeon]|nr:MAG: DUF371 domain-containing protein [Candidatus Lokiarchaeota archaeon]